MVLFIYWDFIKELWNFLEYSLRRGIPSIILFLPISAKYKKSYGHSTEQREDNVLRFALTDKYF